jgi:hypothetical protein
LADVDGLYGTTEGDSVSIYFFYQVEAIAGTSETSMNSRVLADLELTLVDFMILKIFRDDCGGSERKLQADASATGQYVGISSKPADFVLRGCKLLLLFPTGIVLYFCFTSHANRQTFLQSKSNVDGIL